jgi:hypothetical protein
VWPWDRVKNSFKRKKSKDDGLQCERMVKYDGMKIEISGIDVSGYKLGKVGVERTLLQTVSHSLMLLDFAQYDLCTKIRGLSDAKTREEYNVKMVDAAFGKQAIIVSLAGLLANPTSKELQDALKTTLISSKQRVIQIEREPDLILNLKSNQVLSEDAIEIGEIEPSSVKKS